MPNSLASSLVVINPSVQDYHRLIRGVYPGIDIVVLNPDQDGVQQITRAIAQRPHLRQLHIISHGSPACLYLGNQPLNLDTLDHYAAELQQWFQPRLDSVTDPGLPLEAYSSGALLLYGCNVAAGDAGSEFIDRLHQLTGANIAASQTAIGHATLGGNWELETTRGLIPALAIAPDTLARYPGLLTAVDSSTVVLTGGGAKWEISNQLGTSNGLPSGGKADFSSGFGVGAASLPDGSSSTGGVDHGLMLFVNNQIYKADSADLNGSTLTTKSNTVMSGLNVSSQLYADQTNPVLRSFNSFTNSTDADITVPISWVTNLGSNASTELKAVSDVPLSNIDGINHWPNFSFNSNPRWFITDDDDRLWEGEILRQGKGSSFFRPATTQVLAGPGNGVVTPNGISTTVFSEAYSNNDSNPTTGTLVTFNVTIPKHTTKSMMFFYGINNTTAQAIDFATGVNVATYQTDADAVYNTIPALGKTSLLKGLTNQQLDQVLNWQFDGLKRDPVVTPGLTVTPTADQTTSEAGGQATFTVALTLAPTSPVTLTLTSSNPQEGIVTPALTFTSANWNIPQTVTVSGVDDLITDGNVAYSINGSLASGDEQYNGLTLTPVSVVNVDNDPVAHPTPIPSPIVTPPKILQGTKGRDTLLGNAGDDILLGRGGNDRMVGGDGNDGLEGGRGNDDLFGDGGNDSLMGGHGLNSLYGGAGQDGFVLERDGVQIIHDFTKGEDHFELQKLSARGLDFTRQGHDTFISTLDGELLARVKGVTPVQLQGSNFVKL